MKIGQRVKSIRISQDLTQRAFADRLGISDGALSQIESGRTVPSDQTIRSICREFGVSEEWLRTGEGDPFVIVPRNQILEGELRAFLGTEHSEFTERLIRLLLRLPREHWDLLAKYAEELVAENKTDAENE